MKYVVIGVVSLIGILFVGLTISKFLSLILTFILIGWFVVVLHRKSTPSVGSGKIAHCPNCLERVHSKATKCRHCESDLNLS